MLVTPYLPKDGSVIAKNWVREHNKPAFILAYDHCDDPKLHIPTCPNCNGVGFVYLYLADAGPYPAPSAGNKVVKWYDGDGQFGKGWYTVDKSIGFLCPKCLNKPYEPGPVAPMRIDITAMLSSVGSKPAYKRSEKSSEQAGKR